MSNLEKDLARIRNIFSMGAVLKSKGNIMKNKLQQLAQDWGYDDYMDLLEEYSTDSVCPGICMNDGCDYTAEYEPDCTNGWCEDCETGSVKSAMILARVI